MFKLRKERVAFLDGIDATLDGRSYDSNPHEEGSLCSIYWIDGYKMGMKYKRKSLEVTYENVVTRATNS